MPTHGPLKTWGNFGACRQGSSFVETSKLGIYGRYSATIFIGSDKADNINLRVADFIKLNKLSKDELRSNIEYKV